MMLVSSLHLLSPVPSHPLGALLSADGDTGYLRGYATHLKAACDPPQC